MKTFKVGDSVLFRHKNSGGLVMIAWITAVYPDGVSADLAYITPYPSSLQSVKAVPYDASTLDHEAFHYADDLDEKGNPKVEAPVPPLEVSREENLALAKSRGQLLVPGEQPIVPVGEPVPSIPVVPVTGTGEVI
jgi:hypothetical protein